MNGKPRDLVFVCSPLKEYEGHSQFDNITNAINYSRFVFDQGYTPLAPHIIFPQFLDDNNPDERGKALEMGRQILRHCAEIWVFGTYISAGMQDEILLAQQWEIPIKYFNFFNGIYIEVTR